MHEHVFESDWIYNSRLEARDAWAQSPYNNPAKYVTLAQRNEEGKWRFTVHNRVPHIYRDYVRPYRNIYMPYNEI